MNQLLLKVRQLFLLLITSAGLTLTSQAQITSLGSTYFFPQAGTYTPLAGGTIVTAIHGDDAASATLPIGFTFTYMGVGYTNIAASSNGFLMMGTPVSNLTNDLTAGSAGSRPIFAPFWDDCDGRATSVSGATPTASYLTSGVPGSRTFTFEWLNWIRYNAGTLQPANFSMQVILYEATGAIEFVYRQEAAVPATTPSASIGITAVGTGSGNFISLSNAGATPTASTTAEVTTINTVPATGQRYVFTPLNNPDPNGGSGGVPVTIPPIASFSYNDADTVWINSPRTIVNTSNGATSSYWDIIGYNATTKFGFFSPLPSLPRQCKTDSILTGCFLDTVANKRNLNRYRFENPGYYRVQLVALNQYGTDTYIDTIYVDTPSTKPTAEFFADRRTIGVYDFANMFDLSSNGPTSWTWYLNPNPASPTGFVNSFSPSSGAQHPKLNANVGGLFKVCLVARNYRGSDTMCKPDYIRIISGYEVCKGTAKAEDTIAVANEGSAKLSTVDGLYIPSLVGSCSKGFTIKTCSDTAILYIDRFKMRSGDSLRVHVGSLSGPIIARYGGSVIPPAFTTVRIPGGVAYLETFLGNFTGAGDSGYVVRWDAPLASYPKPTAAFSIPDTIYDAYTVFYNNQSTGTNVTYAWDTDGDGAFGMDKMGEGKYDSTSKSPSRSFAVFSAYTANICLKATNCKGSDTLCKNVRFLPVVTAPLADFTVNRTSGFTTDIFRFTDRSQNGANQWHWVFSPNNVAYLEGTNEFSQHPVVLLNSATNYNVQLTATNAVGSNSKTKTSYVSAIAFGSPGCSGCPVNGSGEPFVPSSLDIGISRVTLADMDTSTALNTPIYHPLYNVKTATLYRGVTYTLSTSRISTTDPMSTRAWIDFNRNTTFGDATIETIISEDAQHKTVTTGTFTVPGNTVTGNTRMRVGVTYGNTSITDRVATLGCFEEYGIIIGIDEVKPILALIGSELEKVEVHKPYVEKGVIATDNLEGNISSRVEVFGTVDTSKVGYYVLKYIVRDLYNNVSDTIRRTVQVEINQTGPVLVLNGPDSMSIEVYNSFTDPGFTAQSNIGANLNSQVKITGAVDTTRLGTYSVVYTITDAFGFTSTKTRVVTIKDATAPVITTIAGTPTIQHQVNTPYLDPVMVTDNYWTGLRATRSGVINPNTPGTYNLQYTATDGSGNVATPYMVTVIVKDLIPPTVTLNGSSPMIVDVNTVFNDPLVTRSDNYYINTTLNVTGSVKMNTLDPDTLTYTVTDGAGNSTIVQRIVVKVDRMAPEIELLGKNPVRVCRFTRYEEPGVKIRDNYYSEASLQSSLKRDTSEVDLSRPGYYYITYNVTDGSGNVAAEVKRLVYVTEEDCFTGMEELTANSNMVVYPNPGNGLFMVSTKNSTRIASVKVLDLLGKEVYTKQVNAAYTEVDITTMHKGMYMILLQDENNAMYSGKIVVE